MRAREKDISRRDLLWLGQARHHRVDAEFGNVLTCLSAEFRGVHTGPGATAWPLMPRGAICVPKLRVKAWMMLAGFRRCSLVDRFVHFRGTVPYFPLGL